MIEHLKAIRATQAAQSEQMAELLRRFSCMESAIARMGRDSAAIHGEQIYDRHRVDELAAHITRIETRLDLAD